MKRNNLTILLLLLLTGCEYFPAGNPNICDSIIFHDSVVISVKDSIAIRDSVVISDTMQILETGNGNIEIRNGKNHTFYIDLDSIKVTIRNDSIIDQWIRPAQSE